MRSRSNFLKFSSLVALVAVLALVAVSGTGVLAGSLAQATVTVGPTIAATVPVTSTVGPTIGATVPATATLDPTIGATVPATGTVDPTIGATVPATTEATVVPTTDSGSTAPTSAPTAAGTQGAATGFTGCAPAIMSGMAPMLSTAEAADAEATMAATMDMSHMDATDEADASETEEADIAEEMPQVFAAGGCLFAAALAGTNEVPASGPEDAYGISEVSIDTTLGQVCYHIEVEGITLPARAAHIHRGTADVAGPVVVPLTAPDENGHAAGCINDLDKALLNEILSAPANFYVNVHTSDFPQGAARGQLMSAVKLTGAVEVPVGDTDGFGAASFMADSVTGQICYTIHVSNIILPAAAAHIHKGEPGVAGPVVIPLTAPDEEGVSADCFTAEDKAVVAAILANPADYYVNVHTSDFPKGALRGQLNGR